MGADAAVWFGLDYEYYDSYTDETYDYSLSGTQLIWASVHAAIAGLAGLES